MSGPAPARLLSVLPAAFLALFFGYPVVTLLATAAGSGAGPLLPAGVAQVVLFTVAQAVASTALVVLLGVPGAWVLARFRFPLRGVVEALAVVAFVMPTVVVATAVSATLAADGPLAAVLPAGADRGLGAILLAHVYFNLAVVVRTVAAHWAHLDPRPGEAAAALGAPPWRVFTAVTWPQLRPAVWASAGIVFLFTFTSFGVVLLLGGPGQATIEVEIQRQVLDLFNLRAAAVLSVLQILVVLALLVVQGRLATDVDVSGAVAPDRLRRPAGARQWVAVATFVAVAVALLAGPVVMVVARALDTGTGWGWQHFSQLASARAGSILFVAPAEAIGNSLLYAATATAIAVTVGGMAAYGLAARVRAAGVGQGIWLLPLGVSAVTLGFGMLIAFDTAPLAWRSSFWIVPVAQSLVAIPFVVRALVPALQGIGPRVREAAATLGAGPWRVLWHVELPLLARPLAVATGFAFAISLGEFGATVFLARGDHPTVPVAIYRLLGTPGAVNQGQAMALATILIGLTAAAVLGADRFARLGSGRG